MMPSHDANVGADDEQRDGFVQIAELLGAVIVSAAHRSAMPLPIPPRMARLGRELRSETYKPFLAWRNPRRPVVGGNGRGP